MSTATPPTPPVDGESLAVIHALTTERPLALEEAYNALAAIRSMASANTIARFESKFDAHREVVESKLDAHREGFESKLDAHRKEVESKLDAFRTVVESKFDAQGAQLRMLMWMMGIGIGFVVAGVTMLTFLLELRP